jgi:hypothetical protein
MLLAYRGQSAPSTFIHLKDAPAAQGYGRFVLSLAGAATGAPRSSISLARYRLALRDRDRRSSPLRESISFSRAVRRFTAFFNAPARPAATSHGSLLPPFQPRAFAVPLACWRRCPPGRFFARNRLILLCWSDVRCNAAKACAKGIFPHLTSHRIRWTSTGRVSVTFR